MNFMFSLLVQSDLKVLCLDFLNDIGMFLLKCKKLHVKLRKTTRKLSVVAHVCNSSTGETETAGLPLIQD